MRKLKTLNYLSALLKSYRIRQWTKNLLVFASAFFAFSFSPRVWLNSSVALLAFCLISSAVYLFNDVVDRESDRAHPSKRHRPIASGALPVNVALLAAAVTAAISFLVAASAKPSLFVVIFGYAVF